MRRLCLVLLWPISGACARDAIPPVAETTTVIPGSADAFTPKYSPDGSRLAYVSVVEGKAGIWVAHADGSSPQRLTFGVWDQNPYWSPDGQWIAYAAESPDYDVMLVSASGGEPRALASGAGFEEPIGWLPDGSGVVYLKVQPRLQTRVARLDGSDRPLLELDGDIEAQPSPDGTKVAYEVATADGRITLWLWNATDSSHRQLTTEGREFLDAGAAWSPDSRSVLYRSARTGTEDLWIADVTSGALRQLTSDLRMDYEGRWSPDGNWIAFLSNRGGQDDVWLVPAAGGDAIRVTDDRASEASLAWSPDGRRIAFVRDTAVTQVRAVSVDGGDTRLLSFPDHRAIESRVSPDGRSVLFTSARSGNQDIWVAPLNGGAPRPVTTAAVDDIEGTWSPDGRWIAFSSTRGGSAGIYVVADTGGEARLVVDWPDTGERTPSFSPDGTLIAFQSGREARTYDIWVVPTAGGTPVRVSRFDESTTISDWSADSKHVLVRTGAVSGALYRVSVDGRGQQRLTTPPGANMPLWSPDDSRIAYADIGGGYSHIAVADGLGGNPVRLTTAEQAYDILPHWSPDGAAIAFEQFDLANSTEDIVIINVSDRSVQNLTATPNRSENHPHWTPDGRTIVFQSTARHWPIVTANVAPLIERASGPRR